MNWIRIFHHGLVLGFAELRIFWSDWRVWLVAHIGRATTSAATLILLGRLLGSEDRVHYLLIGQIVMVGTQYVGWTVAAFTWDRMFNGTFVMLVAAPSSLVPAMVGRTSIWILNGVATSFMMFAILTPIFGLPLSLAGLVWTPFLIVVVCVSYYGFAFCMASMVNWAPQLRNIVHNIASILLTAIGGVVVPLTFWPQWVSHIARILPVTHGLRSLRLLLAGGSPREIVSGAAIEILIGLVWFLAGVLTLDRTVNVARRSGAVELA